MEIFENTAANNAGVAKRAIERLLKVVTNDEIGRAGLDRSNIGQLEEVLDTLILLESLNDESLSDIETPESNYCYNYTNKGFKTQLETKNITKNANT